MKTLFVCLFIVLKNIVIEVSKELWDILKKLLRT